jgi:SAM-dependent methyltransferase
MMKNMRREEDVTCPICNLTTATWRVKETDHALYPIQICRSCRYAFAVPRPSIEELKKYYCKNGHGIGTAMPEPSAILDRETEHPGSTLDAKRILKIIQRNLSIGLPKTFLDVGCGYGFFSNEALQCGFEVTALESASYEREVARLLLGFEPVNAWFEETDISSKYSAILMSQVLEHVRDINFWIKKATRLLNKGGVLCVALPSFDSIFRHLLSEKDPYICPPIHLNYFSLRSLKKLLQKHNLETVASCSISRIPISTVEKRMPFKSSTVTKSFHNASVLGMKVMDKIGMGQMLNVYAVRR